MYENGEMSLAKLMRRMGALWTKTQAAKKSNVPQAGPQQAEAEAVDPQQAGDHQALRNVLQSVTEDADVDAPEARLGRAWQEGRGGGGRGARPGRGRGAGRGRGGRVGNAPRATCQRCGGDYARSYLWYHRQRCVGNQDFAWGEGRGGAARGRGAAAEAQPNDDAEGGPAEPADDATVAEAEATEEELNVEIDEDTLEEDEESEEESNHEDVLEEFDEMERTVFGDDQYRRRGRGQKRTAMSVSSSDESESASPAIPVTGVSNGYVEVQV